ncbi:hypothetical protein FOCC_FOCC006902 [Frankliniella occidentalis]|nr:hypothetical protein FOCC_FOCC006902 [Frankliniella occidentalis]
MNVMTQRIRDPELKDFIQESIDECFDILLTGGNVNGRCDFAKNLALCLEEKGKRVCSLVIDILLQVTKHPNNLLCFSSTVKTGVKI